MIGTVRFSLEGKPVGKQRARTHGKVRKVPDGRGGIALVPVLNKRGRQAHTTHTPIQTEVYQQALQFAFLRAKPGGEAPHDGPVRIRVDAYFIPPKSWPKHKITAALAGELRPYTDPTDGDNVLKSVQDALEGFAYTNDRRIIARHEEDWYAAAERTDVELTFEPAYTRSAS